MTAQESTTFIRRLSEDDEGVEVDAWGREVPKAEVTDTAQVTNDAEVTDSGYEGDSQYKDWSAQKLSEELKRRKAEGREIHLAGRTKADAIAALEADDAEAANTEE